MKPDRLLAVCCAAVLLLMTTPAGALKTARMALPADFEQKAEVLKAAGFGGRNKGNYTLGEYSGAFTRGESRLGVFDPLYVASRGKSSFTFTGADGTGLKAGCQLRKDTVTIGIVTLDPEKMSYQCDFSRADKLSGIRFVLGHPKPDNLKERFLAKDIRRGAAVIGERHFTMQSVHNYKGSKFLSQTPVGYLVSLNDQVVAAVELTNVNPLLYLLRDNSADLNESIIIVALAIAVLRDPANSALED